MTTPPEALALAQAWQQAAQERAGVEREQALQAAAYWFDMYQRMVPAPGTGTIVPVPGSNGPGPQQYVPQPGPQGYGQTAGPFVPAGPVPQGPVPPPPGHVPGGYAQSGYVPPGQAPPPGYRAPGYVPPPRRMGAGLIAAIVVLAVALVSGGAILGGPAVVRALTGDVASDGPNIPNIAEPAPSTSSRGTPTPTAASDGLAPTRDPSPSPTTSIEEQWKAGAFAKPLPDPMPSSTSPTEFLPEYPNPTDWVHAGGPENANISVVFTDDVTYNCGLEAKETYGDPNQIAAGCFNSDYPTVLFMYWAPGAAPALKEFILAHELSHLIQWWQKFDVMQSAADAGFFDNGDWRTAVESDATCRVLSWGGYSRDVAARSSSPCTTDSWSEDWLAQQATNLGVTITDH